MTATICSAQQVAPSSESPILFQPGPPLEMSPDGNVPSPTIKQQPRSAWQAQWDAQKRNQDEYALIDNLINGKSVAARHSTWWFASQASIMPL
jgi:hypothetical protein